MDTVAGEVIRKCDWQYNGELQLFYGSFIGQFSWLFRAELFSGATGGSHYHGSTLTDTDIKVQ